MKKISLFASTIIIFGSFFIWTPNVYANTIDVPAGGSIQNAINSAGNGDIIRVAAGTFVETLSINGKANLTLQGAGTGSTIIDNNGAADSGVAITDSTNIKFDGFSVTDSEFGVFFIGSTGTISNNSFYQLTGSGQGEAFFAIGGMTSTFTISGNSIENNNQTGENCGIYFESPSGGITVSNNTIKNNFAGIVAIGGVITLNIHHNNISNNTYIGAIAVELQTGERNVTGSIYSNTIASNAGTWEGYSIGTGIFSFYANLNIYSNRIYSNVGLFGSGIGLFASTASRVYNNIIYNNTSSGWGSGILSLNDSSPIFNNTIINNTASGIGEPQNIQKQSIRTSKTFNVPDYFAQAKKKSQEEVNELLNKARTQNGVIQPGPGNAGGGILVFHASASPPPLYNNIVWSNTGQNYTDVDGNNSITYSDIEQNIGGEGNINQDPRLTNYFPQDSSPVIDTGTSNNAPAFDFAGTTRPQESGIDMGAYEYAPGGLPATGAELGTQKSGNFWFLILILPFVIIIQSTLEVLKKSKFYNHKRGFKNPLY